jgi:hypothetical protein
MVPESGDNPALDNLYSYFRFGLRESYRMQAVWDLPQADSG